MDSTKKDYDVMLRLFEQMNVNPDLFAVLINDVIFITNKKVMGNMHITMTDYDGRDFLIKCYDEKELVFECITTTPIEMIDLILLKTKERGAKK